jgi:hypothetical protein
VDTVRFRVPLRYIGDVVKHLKLCGSGGSGSHSNLDGDVDDSPVHHTAHSEELPTWAHCVPRQCNCGLTRPLIQKLLLVGQYVGAGLLLLWWYIADAFVVVVLLLLLLLLLLAVGCLPVMCRGLEYLLASPPSPRSALLRAACSLSRSLSPAARGRYTMLVASFASIYSNTDLVRACPFGGGGGG